MADYIVTFDIVKKFEFRTTPLGRTRKIKPVTNYFNSAIDKLLLDSIKADDETKPITKSVYLVGEQGLKSFDEAVSNWPKIIRQRLVEKLDRALRKKDTDKVSLYRKRLNFLNKKSGLIKVTTSRHVTTGKVTSS